MLAVAVRSPSARFDLRRLTFSGPSLEWTCGLAFAAGSPNEFCEECCRRSFPIPREAAARYRRDAQVSFRFAASPPQLERTGDSDIQVPAWMLPSGRNNDFQPAHAERRWAGSTGALGLGPPEKFADHYNRENQAMTALANSAIGMSHGSTPKLLLFRGYSMGRYQGLMEVEKHPSDFGGIVPEALSLSWPSGCLHCDTLL